MSRLPNLITALRIPLSIALLFAKTAAAFITLYLLIGLTDMADGFIARRLKAATPCGAQFDTAADAVFMSVLLLRLYTRLSPIARYLILLILFIKTAAYALGLLRYKKPRVYHTFLNKLAGAAVFAAAPPLLFCDLSLLFYAVVIICLAAAAEELCLSLKAPRISLMG